jgi:hypothetical protein
VNAALSGRRGQNPQLKKSSNVLNQRRRSAGNITISKMINLAQNDSSLAMIGQLAHLNDSDTMNIPHSQQILNLPSLKNKINKDETMTTEMEYVNFMKDSNFRASVFQQDESFFRSIIKVDKGETNFTDEKTTENQALHEINEQQIKKIQDL